MRSAAILATTLLLSAGAAQAQEVMGTAGASGSPPANETARQISDWFASSPAANPAPLQGLGGGAPDRQIHGEVGVAIGTNGYRSGYITSVMPLGDTGSLMLSLGQEKNGYYRYGYDGLHGAPMLSPPPPTW